MQPMHCRLHVGTILTDAPELKNLTIEKIHVYIQSVHAVSMLMTFLSNF